MIGQALEAEVIVERLGLSRTSAEILAAYVELIEELGTDDVSLKLIARRAGVGERTIFRHYGTRSELLLGAVTWADQAVFVRPSYDSIFDLPLALRQTMSAYSQRPELAFLVAETMMRGPDGADPVPSRAHLEQLLAAEIPDMGARERQQTLAALCHLDSAGAWAALQREFGMSPADIADAAAWAAEAVLNPLRSRAANG
ncbi:TetR/AcrR family transcriptional regulator [Nesterenkonia populi]|uniref:TetR/AcrR family transcriptional regulator n=1 Tax=Nesterenkonia populi TaxID=1591087 RepID=UPI0011BD6916|nr:TetR/AcrR family transcriptional regulator [Nesterenkonia populi]